MLDDAGLGRFGSFETKIGFFGESEGRELLRGEGEEIVSNGVSRIILRAVVPAKDTTGSAGDFFKFIGMLDEFFAVEGFEVLASFEGGACKSVSGFGIFVA